MKTAFIFPGQGSQTVGMCKDFSGNGVFAEADAALGFKLSEVILNGLEDALKSTENAQPAILAASIAVYTELKKVLKPDVVAGHSLGEYSALVAAEAISFSDAVLTVRKRGEFMKSASGGTMAASLLLPREKVIELCKQASSETGAVVVAANFNCPGQIVISGESKAVEKACELIKAAGGKAIPLSVSGPFHSPLMQPAREKLAAVLANVNIKVPSVKFIANVTAAEVSDPSIIKGLLIDQVTGSVLWEDTVNKMLADGVDTFVEVGPGKALLGMVRKIKRDARVFNVDSLSALEALKAGIA